MINFKTITIVGIICILLFFISIRLYAQDDLPENKMTFAGKNRYGLRLYEYEGKMRLYPSKLYKMFGEKYPDDIHTLWDQDDKDKYKQYPGVRSERIVYRSHMGYDLYLWIDLPEGEGPFPVMFYLFGGGWTTGSPDQIEVKTQSQFLASRGIAGVRVGYSLSSHPEGSTMERAFDDIDFARGFIFSQSDRLDIDTLRFGFMGGSAGAHLSAVSALRTPGTKILVGFSGVYDYNLFGGNKKDYFAPHTVEHKNKVSPIYMIRGAKSRPVSFIIHGLGDHLVTPLQSIRFTEALAGESIECHLNLYPYYSHILNVPTYTDIFDELMEEVYSFLKKELSL